MKNMSKVLVLLLLGSVLASSQVQACLPEDPNFESCLDKIAPIPDTDPLLPSPAPARGTYQCYVRSGKGKLYGPGPESRSRGKAQAAALGRCQKVTSSKCTLAYCEGL